MGESQGGVLWGMGHTFPAGFFLAGGADDDSPASSAFFFLPSPPIDASMAASSCRCSDLLSPDIPSQDRKTGAPTAFPAAPPCSVGRLLEAFDKRG